jgi:hypothetical protein
LWNEGLPRLRKRQLRDRGSGATANEIDIISTAMVAYSSEDPAHPIEFDRPQVISRLSYEVEERAVERSQERCGENSDAGRSDRPIFIQDQSSNSAGLL